MKDSIPPQLARACYTIDGDDDSSDDDSSLEILPPVSCATNENPNNVVPKAGDGQKMSINTSTVPEPEGNGKNCTTDPDDDDDDDAFLTTAKPMFANTTTSASSKSCATLAKLSSRKRPLPQSCTGKASRSTSSLASTVASIASATLNQDASSDESRPPRLPASRKGSQTKVSNDPTRREELVARQLRRNEEKEARVRQKEKEKMTKQQEKLQNQQSLGKFAHQEIVILIDPIITRSNEYGIVTCLEETFAIKEYSIPCHYQKIIQWIRKDYLEGGAEDAWKALSDGKLDQIEHIHRLVVIMDYNDFIPLIKRIEYDENDDYPKLLEWLTLLKRQWQSAWTTTQEPRITLMLNRVIEDLDGEWNKQQRKDKQQRLGDALPSDWELRDALLWILVQHQVDCVHCTSHEEIQTNLHLFTRALAEAPYSAQATELECVRKIKPAANLGEDTLLKVQDSWARQLQMIPKVSEQRARNLVQHYPTLQSLWQMYQQGDENSNRNLLNNCFGSQNAQASLSATVYKVMTCQDPKELV